MSRLVAAIQLAASAGNGSHYCHWESLRGRLTEWVTKLSLALATALLVSSTQAGMSLLHGLSLSAASTFTMWPSVVNMYSKACLLTILSVSKSWKEKNETAVNCWMTLTRIYWIASLVLELASECQLVGCSYLKPGCLPTYVRPLLELFKLARACLTHLPEKWEKVAEKWFRLIY